MIILNFSIAFAENWMVHDSKHSLSIGKVLDFLFFFYFWDGEGFCCSSSSQFQEIFYRLWLFYLTCKAMLPSKFCVLLLLERKFECRWMMHNRVRGSTCWICAILFIHKQKKNPLNQKWEVIAHFIPNPLVIPLGTYHILIIKCIYNFFIFYDNWSW